MVIPLPDTIRVGNGGFGQPHLHGHDDSIPRRDAASGICLSPPRSIRSRAIVSDLSPHTTVPRAGMLATVRNRRGVIAAVEPFDGETGRLHLVHLEYQDDAAPSQERLLWELEPRHDVDEPLALPRPDGDNAMRPQEFNALLRAARWDGALALSRPRRRRTA